MLFDGDLYGEIRMIKRAPDSKRREWFARIARFERGTRRVREHAHLFAFAEERAPGRSRVTAVTARVVEARDRQLSAIVCVRDVVVSIFHRSLIHCSIGRSVALARAMRASLEEPSLGHEAAPARHAASPLARRGGGGSPSCASESAATTRRATFAAPSPSASGRTI